MDDEAHIGLVDAHTKCVSRHHHTYTVLRPVYLAIIFLRIGQPCVIVTGGDPVLFQKPSHINGLLTSSSIDDGTAVGHSLQDMEQLPSPVLRLSYHIDKILAFETHRKDILLSEMEPFLNVINDFRRGCGSECQHRHIIRREQLPNLCYLQIRRAEIITPLRNAMSFVDDQHTHLPHAFEFGEKEFGRKSLRRNVEKFVAAQDCVVKHPDDVFSHHA